MGREVTNLWVRSPARRCQSNLQTWGGSVSFELLVDVIRTLEALPRHSRNNRDVRRAAIWWRVSQLCSSKSAATAKAVVDRLDALMRLLDEPAVQARCVVSSDPTEIYVPADVIITASEAPLLFDELGPYFNLTTRCKPRG